jgi:integrase
MLKTSTFLPSAQPLGEKCGLRKVSNGEAVIGYRTTGGEGLRQYGFRSTFRDWSGEISSFPREVAEMALAHTIENKVEAAYRRGDLFEKRRKMMQAWADYLDLLKSRKQVDANTTASDASQTWMYSDDHARRLR